MADVQFEDEQVGTGDRAKSKMPYARFSPSVQLPGMVRVLLKYNLAKSPEQANHILLGITITFFALAILILGFTAGWFSHEESFYQEEMPLELREVLPSSLF